MRAYLVAGLLVACGSSAPRSDTPTAHAPQSHPPVQVDSRPCTEVASVEGSEYGSEVTYGRDDGGRWNEYSAVSDGPSDHHRWTYRDDGTVAFELEAGSGLEPVIIERRGDVITATGDGGEVRKWHIRRNGEGQIERVGIELDGRVSQKVDCSYEGGRLVSRTHFDDPDAPRERARRDWFRYDAAGELVARGHDNATHGPPEETISRSDEGWLAQGTFEADEGPQTVTVRYSAGCAEVVYPTCLVDRMLPRGFADARPTPPVQRPVEQFVAGDHYTPTEAPTVSNDLEAELASCRNECAEDPECFELCTTHIPRRCDGDGALLTRHGDACFTLESQSYCVEQCGGMDNCAFGDDARPRVFLGCQTIPYEGND